MIRFCNGTDEFLVGPDGDPCVCGRVFDDVDRMVIWPHEPVPPKLTLPELEELCRAAGVAFPY
jgi:hypothetical protein